MSMYEVIGTTKTTPLLAEPGGEELIAIPLATGNGVIARGTVMFRGSDKLYSPAAASDAVDTNYLVVLDEDANTSGEAVVTARAYRSGRLVDGAVVLKAGADVTDAIQLALRKQGIVLKPMVAEAAETNT